MKVITVPANEHLAILGVNGDEKDFAAGLGVSLDRLRKISDLVMEMLDAYAWDPTDLRNGSNVILVMAHASLIAETPQELAIIAFSLGSLNKEADNFRTIQRLSPAVIAHLQAAKEVTDIQFQSN